MRDPNRIDAVLEAVGKAWKQDPDQRLGQLILNAVTQANLRSVEVSTAQRIFYIEDEALAEAVEKFAALAERLGT